MFRQKRGAGGCENEQYEIKMEGRKVKQLAVYRLNGVSEDRIDDKGNSD